MESPAIVPAGQGTSPNLCVLGLRVFELSVYHILLSLFGGAIVLAYWLPRFLSGREPATAALLILFGFLGFGLVPDLPATIGPAALPSAWERMAEVCVIAGLFGVGLRIDRLRGIALWRPTIMLLAVVMPVTIAAVALAGMAAGLSLAAAVLLGAVLAPTDPVLASDVQVGPPTEGGEHPVRFALTTEAGLNDGLAFPFVHLGLALVATGVSTSVLTEWLWRDVGWRIAVGGAAGLGLGWLMSRILFCWPARNRLADTGSGVVALAGIFLVYGLTELVEGYGFIAVFVAAVTLRRIESGHRFHTALHDFSEAIERALTAVLLVALGAAIPSLLPSLDWAGAAIAVALIFAIRPIVGWVALSGSMGDWRERGVVASYGIRGIGSIYYLAYANSHAKLAEIDRLWAIVGLTIVVSSIAHGLTAGFAVGKAEEEPSRSDNGKTSPGPAA